VQPEADGVFVEGYRAVEVRDLEVYSAQAERSPGRFLRAGSRGYPLHQVAAVGFKYLLQRSRRTIRKVLYRPGGSADEPFADRLPECGDAAGCRLGHTGRGEAVDERLVVDGHGLDRPESSPKSAATSR
jgi:hypothetical protein